MSIQIRITQGKNSSIQTVEKRFSPVGKAAHCELNLNQPDIPDVACLLECDFERQTILVHCLHSNLVFLDNQPLKQNDRIQWLAGQEIQLGANCRLLHGAGTPASSGMSKPISRTAHETKTPGPLPRPRRKEDVPSTKPPTRSLPETRVENTRSTQRGNLEVQEMEQQAARKKQSQLIQIILIVICALGCVMMLMIDTKPTPGKKPVISYGALDVKLLQKGNDSGNLYGRTRISLNQANKARSRNESRRIYLDLKIEVERRLQNSTSPDPILDREIMDFINQQI